MDFELVNSVYNKLANDYLADLMQKQLDRVGGVHYTAEEEQFAATLRPTLTGTVPPAGTEARILPFEVGVSMGSTDVGDVTWVVPTIELSAATWVPGTPAHSWQATAAGGMSIGAKGMMVAAKTMALTAAELFSDPTHVAKARAEFAERTAGRTYRALIGRDQKPPLDYRK
jgi:aminobenzoyl-glutamate utilization protein B